SLLLSPLCLTRRLLLVRHGAAPRTLAGARVGVGALAPDRQSTTMPQTAIGTHLDVPLDIHRDFLPQVALDRAFLFEELADMVDLFLAQIADLLVKIDPRAVQQRLRPGPSDSVNIGEPDFDSLLGR